MKYCMVTQHIEAEWRIYASPNYATIRPVNAYDDDDMIK